MKNILKCVLGLSIALVVSTTYSVSPAAAQTPISVSLVANSHLTSQLTMAQSFSSFNNPFILSPIKPQQTFKKSDQPKIIIATVMEKPENTPSPTETASPTPTTSQNTAQIVTAQATTQHQANLGGLNPDVLFALVNNHRTAMGLQAFQQNSATCTLANARAGVIGEEIADGHMHSGFWGNPHPGVSTENIISMNSEQAAFNWWINDYIHRIAIEGPYTYSCVACSANSCDEEFGN